MHPIQISCSGPNARPSKRSRRQSPRLRIQQEKEQGRGKRMKKKTEIFSPKQLHTTNSSSDRTNKRAKGLTKQKPIHNVWQKYRSRLRHQISKIKYHQAFMDAYESEGWRRASAEKLKPTLELQNASTKIYASKVAISELIRAIQEENKSDTKSKEMETPADQESVDVAQVYCSRCNGGDESYDNDILLCDHSGCYRAYHQKCVRPIVLTKDIPAGNDPWFCHQCDCLSDCLQILQDFFHTASWTSIEDALVNIEKEADDRNEKSEIHRTILEADEDFHSSDDASYSSSNSGHSSDEEEEDESDHSSIDLEPTMDELVYHEKSAHLDIISKDKRSTRSLIQTEKLQSSEPAVEFKAMGQPDIGRRIARWIPEEGLCFGTVIRFEKESQDKEEDTKVDVTEQDSWFIVYDDGDEEEIGMQDVQDAFELATRESVYDPMHLKQDEGNLVIEGKRRRAVVDYAALNSALFGTMDDPELEADMFSDFSSGSSTPEEDSAQYQD